MSGQRLAHPLAATAAIMLQMPMLLPMPGRAQVQLAPLPAPPLVSRDTTKLMVT